MSPTSRRIFLYWLLLLVPTLVVGGAAVLLLHNEQARLAERGAYADEARRAAIAARARLIVENVELLVGDVQTGLLDTLAAEPAEDLNAFLDQWEKTNPLVRVAFRSTADGRVSRPDPRTANEEARGFLRRFSQVFGTHPPWLVSGAAPASNVPGEKRAQMPAMNEPAVRQEVSQNVANWQSARRDVQELFKNTQNFIAPTDAASANAAGGTANLRSVPARSKIAESDVAGNSVASASRSGSAPFSSAADTMVGKDKREQALKADPGSGAVNVRKDPSAERQGWAAVPIDGRLHLFGWVQLGGTGEIRGAELDLPALIARMGSALPGRAGGGEGYALRNEQGRVVHQAGAVPRDAVPMIRVPFTASLLPGWDVAAFLEPGPASSGNGGAFFWVSVLLVGIFVAAILAGGSLLLWQARRSEGEAAQKTSFVANVSHEFKTPLTTIRLYAELLEQGRVRDTAQEGDYLRTIGRETQRLARLVNNALDFSRLEQGRKKYACEPVDLAAELGRLLDTHAPRVSEAGLALKRDLPAEPVKLATDRDAIEQIVINLIDNACKYAIDGGEVSVTLRRRDRGGAEIRVADRGPGVPAEHRERIFEKFHRVDDALTAEKTGAGLGLSIARQLARGLGGELRYAPRTGAGAEFVLELR